MSDLASDLRAMRSRALADSDILTLTAAAEEIENLRVLYAHACDSCRREAERAERAEARIDELLVRLNTRTTTGVGEV